MKILDLRAYYGSNIYSYQPVIKIILDLAPDGCRSTSELGDFNRRLLSLLPGLGEHHCSRRRPGGFVERLKEGTYLGHVVEHVALELCKLAGQEVIYGKTRRGDGETVYEVIFEYVSAPGGLAAARAAVELVQALLEGRTVEVAELVERVRQAAEEEYGPSTRAILEAARKRGIPVLPLGGGFYQLGYGRHARRIAATITDHTPCTAVDLVQDKQLCNQLLAAHGVPVPESGIARTVEEALALAEKLGPPVAIKPVNGHHGQGVSLFVSGKARVRRAFELAGYYGRPVLVEKQIPGRQYRLLVVNGRMVAASLRLPPRVVGDGRRTVRELVEEVNRDPRRGEGHGRPLSKIPLDAVAVACLDRQGLTPRDVPGKGQVVYLRDNANLSTGGTAIDVTEQVHPANARLAVRVARLTGLDVAGIDVVVEDIGRPLEEQGGAVIEVNAAPGLRMHTHPVEGLPREVGAAIVDHLFPPGVPCRIPIVAVTGTNGKTTTTRMIGAILARAGLVVGMATSDGIYIDGRRVLAGDTTGPVSARLVLAEPEIDAAVLETARGGILRAGLGYEGSDVGVVTNISGDHLGQDGIETLEDLADVKSLVVETVRKNGYAVLNADDPHVLAMAGRVRGKIIYFSLVPDNITVRRHLGAGGTAVFVKNGMLVVARGQQVRRLLSVRRLPASLGGFARHNIQNALAAAAACLGLGVSMDHIRSGLESFRCNLEQNPGRLNILDVQGIRVVIDYAHNAAGYLSMVNVLRHFKRRLIGVIGVPGDRLDEQIKEVGRIAGQNFSALVIKEDAHRRGRQPGEVAALLREGALEGGMHPGRIRVVLPEGEAVLRALLAAKPGDTVAIFYEKLDTVVKAIQVFCAGRQLVNGEKVDGGQQGNILPAT
ncbi:cyanophycin synthetase [Desulfofundulus thermosubterraneus]|uniref:Cyanophycin synthetase n=1 Tax=Desulfofundulus thermosubterraneus DSM 16057 TaxID=1121432 RepID=A0A1M6CUF4_9FIRM|nr:cyanophycin synthetase [Desulfofundulus thermosubterraneus]SHI64424.1 cyanophycin synthetase [Desulfofundulus thermosubterraneus DSM 16057]